MPLIPPTGNARLIKYINEHRAGSSRYEIDLHLIKSGYKPEQIEDAWQWLVEEPAKPGFLTRYTTWLLVLFLVLGLGVGWLAIALLADWTFYGFIFHRTTLSLLMALACVLSLVRLIAWCFRYSRYVRKIRHTLLVLATIFLLVLAIGAFLLGTLVAGFDNYVDLAKTSVGGHSYHLVAHGVDSFNKESNYGSFELYKCEFLFICPLIESVNFRQIQEFNKNSYYWYKGQQIFLAIDAISHKLIILKDGSEVIYTFKSN